MKNYDRAEIMRRAWKLKKTLDITLGAAITKSWNIAKGIEEDIIEVTLTLETVRMPRTEVSFNEAVASIFGKQFNYVRNVA